MEGQDGRVLNIQLKKPIKARPGYFYIRAPELSPAMQSQPIHMLWWQPNAPSIQHFAVLTDQVKRAPSLGRFPIRLDGPYQEDLHLGKYEAVMFVAQGPALSRVLPHLLYLTTRITRDKFAKVQSNRWYLDGLFSDKTRKVDLYWKMDQNDDISSVSAYFDELSDCGADSKVQAWIFYPEGLPRQTRLPRPKGRQHWFPFDGDFLRQVSSAIETQSKRTPGRAKVVICGSEVFNSTVRRDIRNYIQADNLISLSELVTMSWATNEKGNKQQQKLRKTDVGHAGHREK
ncbi:ferredoxin reductase (FNR) [Metarhizium robertsii]|uniref:FAD-binding FR-type domain-containing protein n=2 Tax=Metarhizium robertsii TaxID=568076 RepID=E9FD58_METRA|nr:uncharacterized protein MAA_10207 [Metarhizium robertsii ARSEF 23]EFY94332.1 hypothetical protein MAA_10207 [Metarhizium robertsii ARSEF 23]EXU95039.1 ferredoxin reductase (FNR) [Metarhizium robertsii]